LRRQLPDGAIRRRAGGYTLTLDGEEFDLETFERLAAEGHAAVAAGEYERATTVLRDGLALWRGPALAGLGSAALRHAAARLEEQRLSALEDRIEADLGYGLHGEIVAELPGLVAEHPLRERLRAQLMRALYRSGRASDALAQYREVRRLLVDELGMEPGQELRELEHGMLRQDAELNAPASKPAVTSAAPLASGPEPPVVNGAGREVRKTVTVLFCDVVDSTGKAESNDPEVVRALLARYFERMRTVVEFHGGTVEKFIGDAVMAVFAVPVAHEDDALRACRAALEMRESFEELGLEGRIGITTGEVVTGTEERLATGDPVNVAARLQQAAESSEVLIGDPTFQLVREEAEVDLREPFALKGKAEPVKAYQLLAVHDAARPHETRFVGRQQELADIREAWERALEKKHCELVTIIGEAGVGKSRLVAEALAKVDARVVEGRCLSYGDGVTYWPVVEVIKQLEGAPSDPIAAAALRSLLGGSNAEATAEEIAWGFRKLLEERAPLIVVFDDIQWGEEAFLDLVEHIALLSSGVPILLLCMARPDLVERRSSWAVTIRLEPLAADDVEKLIGDRGSAELRARIARAAAGNPLFVEEMLAMAAQTHEAVTVPPTLRALLAARLDQLEPGERKALECGAVEGEVFHRGALHAMSPEEAQVTPHLAALVRKGLIRRHGAQIPGDDGFRFRHLLIRDVAYEGLPKSVRAELHERFASWLEISRLGVEFDEIVGYHLEQAAGYKQELGEENRSLAERGGESLAAAGRRALWRGDFSAAANLLERALVLARPSRLDVHLEVDLAVTERWRGAADRAVAIAEAAADRARHAGDRGGEMLARVVAASDRVGIAAVPDIDGLEALARDALPLLEQADDHDGLVQAWQAIGEVANMRCRWEERARAAENALSNSRLAGHNPPYLFGLDHALVHGPRPADEALRRLDAALSEFPYPALLLARAGLLAMLGRFEEAWPLAHEANERHREMTGGWNSADALGDVATLAGDHSAAASYLRTYCEDCERRGLRGLLASAAPTLALTLCALGREAEAEPLAARGRELASALDLDAQANWRQAEALVRSARGEARQAERLAREAVAISEQTDDLSMQGRALRNLGEVLQAAGRGGEAVAALEEALQRYERKRNLAMVGQVRARLTELRASLP
jgi:class 3 adenylate cyclase/tetratricopeptide (TPR) repeat protein